MATSEAKASTAGAGVAHVAATSERKVFIGGNWKMYGTRETVRALVAGLNSGEWSRSAVDAVVAPTALHIDYVHTHLTHIQVSAQNCAAAPKPEGAFTGEISAAQLRDFGVRWVILGHSERRQIYGESCSVVAQKISIALKSGLSVIACLGETLAERKAEQTIEVVVRQLKAIADAVVASGEGDAWSRVVLAYEPVWAIGTGVVASPDQAQAVHAEIRKSLATSYGASVATTTRIIYGGSVKPDNCDALIALADVDGFLVGGASLVPADFVRILNAGHHASHATHATHATHASSLPAATKPAAA